MEEMMGKLVAQGGQCSISGVRLDLSHSATRRHLYLSPERKNEQLGYTSRNYSFICYCFIFPFLLFFAHGA
jgi:hypothetical protein